MIFEQCVVGPITPKAPVRKLMDVVGSVLVFPNQSAILETSIFSIPCLPAKGNHQICTFSKNGFESLCLEITCFEEFLAL